MPPSNVIPSRLSSPFWFFISFISLIPSCILRTRLRRTGRHFMCCLYSHDVSIHYTNSFSALYGYFCAVHCHLIFHLTLFFLLSNLSLPFSRCVPLLLRCRLCMYHLNALSHFLPVLQYTFSIFSVAHTFALSPYTIPNSGVPAPIVHFPPYPGIAMPPSHFPWHATLFQAFPFPGPKPQAGWDRC